MIPERELALKMAVESNTSGHPEAIVRAARMYLDFLTGEKDGEIATLAREFASKIAA